MTISGINEREGYLKMARAKVTRINQVMGKIEKSTEDLKGVKADIETMIGRELKEDGDINLLKHQFGRLNTILDTIEHIS